MKIWDEKRISWQLVSLYGLLENDIELSILMGPLVAKRHLVLCSHQDCTQFSNYMARLYVSQLTLWRQENLKQCCGSVSFWYGSRSADPFPMITDPDPNPHPDSNPDPDLDPGLTYEF